MLEVGSHNWEPPPRDDRRRGRSLRPWLRRLVALAILVCGLGVGFVCLGQPAPRAPAAHLTVDSPLIGRWRLKKGILGNPQRTAAQQMALHRDGTFSWDTTQGTFALTGQGEVAFSVTGGETYHYRFALSGETLTLERATTCGRYDQLVYQRER